ncbi:MAG: transporter [Verrucomicrobiota bacterium]
MPVLVLLPQVRAADKSGYSVANPVPRELLRALSTDRPDQTESPYTVDAGHWQIEMDLCNLTHDHDTAGGADLRVREWRLAPVNLKLGLTSRLDVQFMLDPHVSSRVEDRTTGAVTRASGVGDVTTRIKFNLRGNDGGPTAFAVMPFVKWPLSASEVRNGETEGGVIAILGYELPGGWGSAVMTEVDSVSDGAGGRDTEWINSITFARDLTARLGGYLELFTVISDAPGADWQAQFDLGLTYAVSDDVQLDVGCNFGITESAPDYQPFLGLSRRF